MKNSLKSLIIGLGLACLVSGGYWIYKDGDLLEIILPFVIGISLIGSVYIKSENNDIDPE